MDELTRSQKYLAKNREAINARRRARYAADPSRRQEQNRQWNEENREHRRQHGREWYQRNLESERDRSRAKINPERALEASRRWRRENPEGAREAKRRRRARRLGSNPDLTIQQWVQILEEFDHCCAYCQTRTAKLEQEHMTPLARGGRHTRNNVVPACRNCNARKHACNIFEFLGRVP